MIDPAPYENAPAWAVLSRLDPADWAEMRLLRGDACDPLDVFGDWRAMQAGALVSLVLRTRAGHDGAAFAVLALGHTGQAGVAQAALLARDHARFARPLARTAVLIRRRLPEICAGLGVCRIEARCWREHPTAPRFLARCGFAREADMPGFGPGGAATFSLFAWTEAALPHPEEPHERN